jgi:probable F420-dependent oxidoreductase
MRVGVTAFLTDRSIAPVEFSQACADRGFDGVYVPEHTHIPTGRATPAPMGEPLPEQYWRALDPFVALTAAATAVPDIKVGTGICLVAQHDPSVLAKQVATLDHLSGGRFVFGIGFGWNRDEAEDHGVDFARRRDHVREAVLLMKALWTQDEASFDGEFVSMQPSRAWPKPAQRPHPPVYIGGAGGPKMFAAVAEYADGWMPIGGRGIKAALPVLRAACEVAGRDPSSVVVIPFGTIPEAGKLEYYATLGIQDIVLGIDHGARDHVLAELDRFAPIVAPFRE